MPNSNANYAHALNFFVRHASGRNLTSGRNLNFFVRHASGRNLKTTKISPAGMPDSLNANDAHAEYK
jgi:hypothetical protein